MFQFSYVGKSGSFLHYSGLNNSLHSIYWNLSWISVPIALLIASVIAVRTIAFVRARRAQPIDLLLIFCVAGLLAYVPWYGAIGKYTVPPVAAGVLAAGIELGNRLMALQRPVLRTRDLLVASATVVAAALLLLVGTPLQFRPPGFYLSSTGLGVVTAPHIYLGLKLVAFPVLLFGAWRLLHGRPRSEVWLVAAAAYLLIANPIDIAKLAVVATGSSPYRAYAEPGFDATVAFLNASLSGHPGEVILAPKDIGFYFQGHHYGMEDVADIGDIATRPNVRYVVDSTLYPTVTGLDGVMRDRSMREVKRIGAFVVYENPGYNGA
jgi:hypothetical protein